MTSIVIVENGASQSRLVKALESAKATSAEVLVVSTVSQMDEMNGVRVISSLKNGLAHALHEALESASGDRVIIADARLSSYPVLTQFITETEQSAAVIAYAAVQVDGESIELPDLLKNQIVPVLGMYSQLPFQLISIDRAFALQYTPADQSFTALMATWAIHALIEDEQVQRTETIARADRTENAESLCGVSDEERARLLSIALDQCNIEDLFPNHAWDAHHEESAAAAYHSLAASFVRLGDSASALECLKLSDQLEDSPRSLALKGLIALDRGEILGAVANMVSSLQQYETRKQNDGSHYLSFQPKDLERINSRLQQGLQALNKRDNVTALEHFADAVFHFDDFYTSFGVDRLREIPQ